MPHNVQLDPMVNALIYGALMAWLRTAPGGDAAVIRRLAGMPDSLERDMLTVALR